MEPLEYEYINNPSYYKGRTGMEAIDVIEEFELNFSLGNVIKYVLRAGKKDSETTVEDLQKAINYIKREIQRVENKKIEGMEKTTEFQEGPPF